VAENRSIVNHEEFSARLVRLAQNEPENIRNYILGTIRKHYLKHWERTTGSVAEAESGLSFKGFTSSRGVDLDPTTIVVKLSDGQEVVKHVTSNDEVYHMLKAGHVTFLDCNFIEEIQAEIATVLDWIRQAFPPTRNINHIAFPAAQAKAIQWHRDLANREARKKAQERKLMEEFAKAGTIPFHRIDASGETWYLCNLITEEALRYEGSRLHHCVGLGYYWDMIRAEVAMIWSVRVGKNLDPLLTLTVNRDVNTGKGYLVQMLGLQNRRPTQEQNTMVAPLLTLLEIGHNLPPSITLPYTVNYTELVEAPHFKTIEAK
jgi:hypothetical protein